MKKMIYAVGQFGWTLCAFGVSNLLVAFYVPGADGTTMEFPVLIYQGYLFGFFTAIGLILALTRIFDATASLFSASLCDRNRLKRNRRTGMMTAAVIPFAVLSVAMFVPPTPTDYRLNSIWLLIGISMFYLFMALYAIPYFALLTEIGKDSLERTKISALQALFGGMGFLLGTGIWHFTDFLVDHFGLSAVTAFRLVLAVFACVGTLAMLLPVLFLRLPDSAGDPVRERLPASANRVFADRNYRPFLVADSMYWLANTIVLTGFQYYSVYLLRMPVNQVLLPSRIIILCSFLFYYPAYRLVRLWGKRRPLFIAFLLFTLLFSLAVFIGKYPGVPFLQATLLVVFFSFPVALFSIIPNALVADMAVAAEIRSGTQRSAMYFGVRSVIMKTAQMVAVLIFPSLMLVGSRGAEVGRLGLRLTLVLAAVLSLSGFISLFWYREKEVRSVLELREKPRLQA